MRAHERWIQSTVNLERSAMQGKEYSMSAERGMRTVLAMAAVLVAVFAVPGTVPAAEAKEYSYAVISGTLKDPETKGPMVGATIRLVEADSLDDEYMAGSIGGLVIIHESITDSEGRPVIRQGLATIYEAMTDAEGRFVFTRLPPNRLWRLEILTASGELIRSTSRFDLSSGRVELILGISKRLDRASKVDTNPQPGTRWVISGVRPPKWKRFWKQFGIFIAGAGALAL